VHVPRWFSVKEVLLAVLVGLLVGYGAFLLTAQDSQDLVISSCTSTLQPGFDPLTGLPHSASFECPQLTGLGGQVPVRQDAPMSAGLASRRAVPVPLGFVLGFGAALLVLAARRIRRESEPS
jgi:hypothetical protein